jgi:TPR repeat protein
MNIKFDRDLFLVLMISIYLFSGCTVGANKIPTTNADDLTEERKVELIERGNNSENWASLKLYSHYKNIVKDDKQALYWLRKSAIDGNKYAQNYLVGWLLKESKIEEAMSWLRLSADNGNEAARDELQKKLVKLNLEYPTKYKVGASGNLSTIIDASGNEITPLELAKLINNDSNYTKGATVDLLSSNAGKGDNSYAQRLANALCTLVRAPDNNIWYYPSGNTIVAAEKNISSPDLAKMGKMRTFYPERDSLCFQMSLFSKKYIEELTKGHQMRNQQPMTTAMIYNLTKPELDVLTEKAKNNDKSASFRLYQYYSLSKRDLAKELFWLNKSAVDGNAVAQYNLAYHYENSGNIKEALHWLKLAVMNSDPQTIIKSKEMLVRLNQKSKKGFDKK